MPAHRRFRSGRVEAHRQQCTGKGAGARPGQVIHGQPGVFEDLHHPDMSIRLGAAAAERKAELGAREMPAQPFQILRRRDGRGAGRADRRASRRAPGWS